MGQYYSPEALKRKRAQTKKYQRLKYIDPEYRAEINRKNRENYHKNRERHLKTAREYQTKNKELLSERRKQSRRENPELARIKDRKHYANTFRATIAKFRRGDITVDEFSRRLGRSLTWADERTKPGGRGRSNDGLRVCETDSKPSKTET